MTKPSIDKLLPMTQAAYVLFTKEISDLSWRRSFSPWLKELPTSWDELSADKQEAFLRAAYAAIVWLPNPLLPVGGQAYNGYCVSFEDGLDFPSWVLVPYEETKLWSLFAVAVRDSYKKLVTETKP